MLPPCLTVFYFAVSHRGSVSVILLMALIVFALNGFTPPTSNVPRWPFLSPVAGYRYNVVSRQRRNVEEAAGQGRYYNRCPCKSQ